MVGCTLAAMHGRRTDEMGMNGRRTSLAAMNGRRTDEMGMNALV